MKLISNELKIINKKYKINILPNDFQNLKLRVFIDILSKGQMFGESEFLEKKKRVTRAVCMS